jgi:hypothetical protein
MQHPPRRRLSSNGVLTNFALFELLGPRTCRPTLREPYTIPVKTFTRIVFGIGILALLLAVWIIGARSGLFSKEKSLISSCSFDQSHCSTLVVQGSLRGSGSDVYVLRIKNTRNPLAWSYWADFGKGQPVLYTTEARPSKLVWRTDERLEVICESCHLNEGDVFGEVTKSGTVDITYTGFIRPLE